MNLQDITYTMLTLRNLSNCNATKYRHVRRVVGLKLEIENFRKVTDEQGRCAVQVVYSFLKDAVLYSANPTLFSSLTTTVSPSGFSFDAYQVQKASQNRYLLSAFMHNCKVEPRSANLLCFCVTL